MTGKKQIVSFSKFLTMRLLIFFLAFCPLLSLAQVNPVFIYKDNIPYTKLELSGDDMFGFEENGKLGYLDKNLNVVIPAIYEYESISYKSIPFFSGGYVRLKKDGKFGLVNKAGKTVLPFEYETVYAISNMNNYAIVSKPVNSVRKYGLVNMQNKTIIPFEYDDMIADSNLVAVKQSGKWGVLDVAGKKLIPLEYTNSLSLYPKDKIVKTDKDGKTIFIDLTGNIVFEKPKNVYTIMGATQGMILCSVNSKYGFLDLKGNEVIITKYDNAYNFETVGLAKVGRKESSGSYTYKYGYIDKTGKEIIPVNYMETGYFYNGLVYAKDPETNRYGYLDKTGKWAIPATYIWASSFDGTGGAWVKMTDDKYHYINKTGKDLGAFDDKTYKAFNNTGYAIGENTDYPCVLMDNTGKVVKRLTDADGIYTFSEGIAGYKAKGQTKYGFIDYTGKIITPAIYDGFSGFADGLSRVVVTTNGKLKYGYINTSGQVVVPIEYDTLSGYRNGWGIVTKGGKQYFIDKNNNQKDLPRKYDNLVEFNSGFAVGVLKGTNGTNTYYYINTDLKEQFSIVAKEAYSFWDNVAVVKRENDYELMNTKGEVYKTLTGIPTLKFASNDIFTVYKNGKWGYMDKQGEMITQAKYDSCESFKYGYGRFKMNGKWGIVDKSGKEIIEAKYENILPGDNDLFIAYETGKSWGAIDKTGKTIIPPSLYTATPFDKNRILAKLGKTFTVYRSPLIK